MRIGHCRLFVLLVQLVWSLGVFCEPHFTSPGNAENVIKASNSRHTNNWAVLVSTSRFWFNYRHMANVLSMYRTVKRLGIPDSQIILMLSDDIACNPRNAFPGSIFNNKDQAIDLYGNLIEVDYRGYEVTVENFIRLLTDRWDANHPRSKRLLTDENSNIFVYLTGHGGNEFLKFQDSEELGAHDIADAFEQMYEKKRYNEIFFMIDTCQANSMYERFYSPNILAVGSSAVDESSYSHHSDLDIGVAVIDRFTYFTLDFLERIDKNSNATMDKLFDVYVYDNIHSTPKVRTDLFQRNVSDVLLTDFFGNVRNVVLDEIDPDIFYIYTHKENGTMVVPRDLRASYDKNETGERVVVKERSPVFQDEDQPHSLSSLSQFNFVGCITFLLFVSAWMFTK